MKKSKRLSVLIKIEEANEREEARKFSGYQQVAQENRKKLSDLEGYLNEYKEMFAQLSTRGTEADKIRSCYAFISQLNMAISQQRKMVGEAERTAEEYRQNWLQAKQRMDILEKAIGKFRDEELRHEQKTEQMLADELISYRRRDD
jgi:flagellar FliJ protein